VEDGREDATACFQTRAEGCIQRAGRMVVEPREKILGELGCAKKSHGWRMKTFLLRSINPVIREEDEQSSERGERAGQGTGTKKIEAIQGEEKLM